MDQPKFYITNEDPNGATWHPLNVGGGEFKLIDEEVKGEEFSRVELTGKMKLTRDNYFFVKNESLETRFTVILVLSNNTASINNAEWRGEFYKTDCEIFEDENRIEVTPTTVDSYKEIMEGIAKDFDLIEIEPPLTPLQLQRRAVLQIYVRGAQKITNYVDSAFFEEAVANGSEVHSVLVGDYKFGYSGRKYFITGGGTGLSPDISGTYIYDSGSGTSLREDGIYRLGVVSIPDVRVRVTRESDGFLEYLGAIDDPIPNIPVENSQGVLLTSQTDSNSQCRAFYVDFYSRILTKKETIGGSATFPIPSTDILNDHGVFTRIHQITYTNFLTSEGNTVDGSRWGKFPDNSQHFGGNHYLRPTAGVYYPVLQSNWFDASFWVQYDAQLLTDLEEANDTYIVKHAYKVVDVISSLLEAMGSNVAHEESTSFSQFLYGATNSIRGAFRTPFIIPITNVLVGDYDEPQQVAKISLQDIFNLYDWALRAKWAVLNDKLIIEHKHYFENGGSYITEVVGTDLTGVFDVQNDLSLSTGQNRWRYEKNEMPERFEYSWQGKSSKPFIGYPMDINSPFVEKGNVKKWNIGRFNSDIDLIHVGGSEVSKEGFLFVDAIMPNLIHEAPFVTVVIDTEEEYNLQNGYAAFVWLVPNLHRYCLPGQNVTINRYPSTALTVARRRIQEVNLPTLQQLGTLELIATGLGNGKAYRIEKDVFTTKKKINLRHSND